MHFPIKQNVREYDRLSYDSRRIPQDIPQRRAGCRLLCQPPRNGHPAVQASLFFISILTIAPNTISIGIWTSLISFLIWVSSFELWHSFVPLHGSVEGFRPFSVGWCSQTLELLLLQTLIPILLAWYSSLLYATCYRRDNHTRRFHCTTLGIGPEQW